jgi:tetratricopeptide (TPR) repeat protein
LRSDVPEIGLELAANLVEAETFSDMAAAVEELAVNSLIETAGADADRWIHVPFPAWTFGKQKLKSYPREVDIQRQRELLMLLGPHSLRDGNIDLPAAIVSFWDSARKHVGSPSWGNWRLGVEHLANSYPPLWDSVGEAYETAGDWDSAVSAYKRRIEVEPNQETWLALAKAYEKEGKDDEALHAWVRRATSPGAAAADASHAANKLNGWLARGRVTMPVEARRTLAEPLIAVLEDKSDELDADGFARLAWLYKGVDDHRERGNEAAKRGLQRDPENIHCGNFLGPTSRR